MSIKHVPIIAKLFCFVISIAMDFIIRQKKNLARLRLLSRTHFLAWWDLTNSQRWGFLGT